MRTMILLTYNKNQVRVMCVRVWESLGISRENIIIFWSRNVVVVVGDHAKRIQIHIHCNYMNMICRTNEFRSKHPETAD